MQKPILWHDNRYGDSYDIYLDDNHQFEMAVRYRERLGVNGIVYHTISELPDHHRKTIEQIVWKIQVQHVNLNNK